MALRSNRDWTVEEFDEWYAARRNVDEVMEATGRGGRAWQGQHGAEAGQRSGRFPARRGPAARPPQALKAASFPSSPSRAARSAAGARPASGCSSRRWPKPARSICRPRRRGCRRAAPMPCASDRPHSRPPGTRRSNWPSAACPLSPSTAPSMAGSSEVYHQGDLVGEKRVPSDKLLTWLLARLDPKRFAAPWERPNGDAADPQGEAQSAFPALIEALTDVAAD